MIPGEILPNRLFQSGFPLEEDISPNHPLSKETSCWDSEAEITQDASDFNMFNGFLVGRNFIPTYKGNVPNWSIYIIFCLKMG